MSFLSIVDLVCKTSIKIKHFGAYAIAAVHLNVVFI